MYSNFFNLLFCEYGFIIPSSIFPFPSFVIGFSGPAVPQELSVWEHVCTNMVLIRMPLLPLGPLTVGLLFFFFPLKLALTSCFCYYSWCRTRSHLFFLFLFCWRMTGQQKRIFCSSGFYFLWWQHLCLSPPGSDPGSVFLWLFSSCVQV